MTRTEEKKIHGKKRSYLSKFPIYNTIAMIGISSDSI